MVRAGLVSAWYGVPLKVTVPVSGRVRPTIMRMVVDLPDPFGPTKPVTRPAGDGEGEVVDGSTGAVGLGESFDGDHRTTSALVMRAGVWVAEQDGSDPGEPDDEAEAEDDADVLEAGDDGDQS